MKTAYQNDSRIIENIPVVVTDGALSQTRKLEVPVFSLEYLAPGMCSAYVRLAAEELFGVRYSQPCPAWQRRFQDRLVMELNGNGDSNLSNHAKAGDLQPGMAVGFLNPLNPKTGQTDKEGNYIHLTHLALFLGLDPKTHEAVIAHQYGKETKVERQGDLRFHPLKRLLIPKEIIAPRHY